MGVGVCGAAPAATATGEGRLSAAIPFGRPAASASCGSAALLVDAASEVGGTEAASEVGGTETERSVSGGHRCQAQPELRRGDGATDGAPLPGKLLGVLPGAPGALP